MSHQPESARRAEKPRLPERLFFEELAHFKAGWIFVFIVDDGLGLCPAGPADSGMPFTATAVFVRHPNRTPRMHVASEKGPERSNI